MQLSATHCIKSHEWVFLVLSRTIATIKNIYKIGGYLKTPP